MENKINQPIVSTSLKNEDSELNKRKEDITNISKLSNKEKMTKANSVKSLVGNKEGSTNMFPGLLL